MTEQYRIERSDQGPSPPSNAGRWRYFREAVQKALDERYMGWVIIELPSLGTAKSATGSIRKYRKDRQIPLVVARRKQHDGTHKVYVRWSKVQAAANA